MPLLICRRKRISAALLLYDDDDYQGVFSEKTAIHALMQRLWSTSGCTRSRDMELLLDVAQ